MLLLEVAFYFSQGGKFYEIIFVNFSEKFIFKNPKFFFKNYL